MSDFDAEPRNITIGDQVSAAFRLFDVLPFLVRWDLARLIYLYLHDPEGYAGRRGAFLAATAPRDSSSSITEPVTDVSAASAEPST